MSPCAVFHGLDVEVASASGLAISVNPVPILIWCPSPSTQIVYDNSIEIIFDRGGILLLLLVFLARLQRLYISDVWRVENVTNHGTKTSKVTIETLQFSAVPCSATVSSVLWGDAQNVGERR